MERRTLREWFAYLDSTERELTITELMAVMLMNQREYARLTLELVRSIKDGGEHTEAMLGALDVLGMQVAALNGLPYAASGEIRAALAAQRRALAAESVPAARETALPTTDGSRPATEG